MGKQALKYSISSSPGAFPQVNSVGLYNIPLYDYNPDGEGANFACKLHGGAPGRF